MKDLKRKKLKKEVTFLTNFNDEQTDDEFFSNKNDELAKSLIDAMLGTTFSKKKKKGK